MKIGPKGQIVIPKTIREALGIQPGDEIVMEVREKELLMKPELDPEKFVEEFFSTGRKKLTRKIDLKRIMEEEAEDRLALRDSNIFIYPVIYDPASVREAANAGSFLLHVQIEAYASSVTWDETAWVARKILGVAYRWVRGENSWISQT
ncbi:MAG: AbrB/MazE/SpoVT family DNA-binding domain-containing protein [Candidatus Brockarchaeota archaeon]|nr:AbrB/MazE/SpoVT family DNA-binding domain-containing protein [Candidatus Brockarchaeota archaeon]MBO3808886.1 AbrB/MazE/SpoVT family DNA-binding domain-containing protein [Candidatus Brockarchaeota archaeon]